MSLETITQTAKAVAQRLKPHVKIVAHHVLPNLNPLNTGVPSAATLADIMGLYAKGLACCAILRLTLSPVCTDPGEREALAYACAAVESIGIILQNGIYENVRRLYEIRRGHSNEI